MHKFLYCHPADWDRNMAVIDFSKKVMQASENTRGDYDSCNESG